MSSTEPHITLPGKYVPVLKPEILGITGNICSTEPRIESRIRASPKISAECTLSKVTVQNLEILLRVLAVSTCCCSEKPERLRLHE